jgi:hypothetical protein
VGVARQKGMAEGRKLRTDTTAVETNVHFPTDSALLGDGIHVLSRSLKRIAHECKSGALEVVNHGRAVKHRLLEISRAAKSQMEASRQRMRNRYQKLLALTRNLVRQSCAAGALDPLGPKLFFMSTVPAAFGGSSGILWADSFMPIEARQMKLVVHRSPAWWVAGVVFGICYVVILGRGIQFSQ